MEFKNTKLFTIVFVSNYKNEITNQNHGLN